MNDHTGSPYEYWMSLHNVGGRASPGRCWLPEEEQQAREFVNEQPFRRILVKVVVCPEDLARLRKGWWNMQESKFVIPVLYVRHADGTPLTEEERSQL